MSSQDGTVDDSNSAIRPRSERRPRTRDWVASMPPCGGLGRALRSCTLSGRASVYPEEPLKMEVSDVK